MRDIVLEETIYMDFTTRAFGTGIPTVLAGSPVLSVLEENNATPITAGVSVSVNRASVVGLNEATIVATAANGYEAGKGYSVYISTGTVGGVSVVGEVVASFTIDASSASQDLANGTDGLGAIKADTAATLTDTADMQPKVAKIPLSDGTITWNSTALGSINAEADTALTDYDGPTNAELNARTLLAASYFDFTSDAVQVGTNSDKTGYSISGTLNTLDDLENLAQTDIVTSGAIQTGSGIVINVAQVGQLLAIANDVITASSIAAGALDGKGDWNIGKTGYEGTATNMRGTDDALLAASYTAPDNAGITANGVAIAALNDIAATDIVTGGAITTSAGDANVNIVKINGVTIIGDGAGTPFDV